MMATTTYIGVTYKDDTGDITQERLELAQDVQSIISITEIKEVIEE